jgi:hypothetical protein
MGLAILKKIREADSIPLQASESPGVPIFTNGIARAAGKGIRKTSAQSNRQYRKMQVSGEVLASALRDVDFGGCGMRKRRAL